mmetsp:Transcript_22531/g.90322  ORF Transcript_22531/g.90322 Transcript_22531/m.90322 type:complete len:249 (+) Transcript_22531:320-1066(+)
MDERANPDLNPLFFHRRSERCLGKDRLDVPVGELRTVFLEHNSDHGKASILADVDKVNFNWVGQSVNSVLGEGVHVKLRKPVLDSVPFQKSTPSRLAAVVCWCILALHDAELRLLGIFREVGEFKAFARPHRGIILYNIDRGLGLPTTCGVPNISPLVRTNRGTEAPLRLRRDGHNERRQKNHSKSSLHPVSDRISASLRSFLFPLRYPDSTTVALSFCMVDNSSSPTTSPLRDHLLILIGDPSCPRL